MSAAAVCGEAATLLVLAEVVDDGAFPKTIVLVGIAALLGSMCTRLAADIVQATKEPPAPDEQTPRRRPQL